MSDTPEEERSLIKFLKLKNATSNWRIDRQKPPEPDFILISNGKRIGIEHTRLMKTADNKGVDPVLHEKESRNCIKKAEEIFRQKSDDKLHVFVSFSNNHGLHADTHIFMSKKASNQLAPQIAEIVFQNIPAGKEWKTLEKIELISGQQILPDGIDEITISNTNYLNTSCWSESGAHVVPDIIRGSNFNEILKKKNNKPDNYKCDYDEIWLLMVCNSAIIYQVFDFPRKELRPVQSTFDKVFIFREDEEIIHDLIIES